MKNHTTILGIIYTIFGAFGMLVSFILILIFTPGGSHSIYTDSMLFNSQLGKVISGVWLIISIPAFIGGLGLFKRMQWARIAIIFVAAIQLINFPFGTGISIYTFWTLLDDDVKDSFH
jgi:hypothetical protein